MFLIRSKMKLVWRSVIICTAVQIQLMGPCGEKCVGAPPQQDRIADIEIEGMIDLAAENAIERGLNWLARSQNADGSFGGDRQLSGNVAVCALAGLAFLCEGSTPDRGPYATEITRCTDFILRHQSDSGLINNPDFSSNGPMYGHGFAMLLLAEVQGMSPRYQLRSNLERAVALLVDTQNDEGGWRYQPVKSEADVSVTVCQMMALRAAKNAGIYVPAETVDRCLDYVKRAQNPDGGFSYRLQGARESEFPRSAAAVVALQSAGIYEGPEIDAAIAYLLQFRPAPNQVQSTYFYYGHYYAVQAMWQEGGEPWQRWFPAIRNGLVELQRSEGAWTSRYSPEYSTAMALIVLQIPNNVLPIFQR